MNTCWSTRRIGYSREWAIYICSKYKKIRKYKNNMMIYQSNFIILIKGKAEGQIWSFAITYLHLCFIFFPARFESVSPGPRAGMFGWFHSGTVHWLFRLSMFLTTLQNKYENNISIWSISLKMNIFSHSLKTAQM